MTIHQKPHGEKNHVNIYELDHTSRITGLGQHDRVIVFCPDHEGLYVRVDHLWDLGMPSEKQILTVAKMWPHRVKGRWQLHKTETSEDGSCTDVYFKKVLRKD